ncbi:MAG: hypothetical protein H0V92_00715 [Pseudonocardiales bacterium]|nr:hypothetical protein [Pseudonocardiales bacterium]
MPLQQRALQADSGRARNPAGRGDHLDDRAHALAFLAEPPADRVLVLDLGGGVRAVAELVLQPLRLVGDRMGADRVSDSPGSDDPA